MGNPPEAEEFTIRAATLDDLAALARHRCEMFREMGQLRDEHYQELAEASVRYFEWAMPAGEYVAWVVSPREQPDVVVAGGGMQLRRVLPGTERTGELRKPGPQGIIVNVFTEREWRRRGLARLVMEAIIDWSRENGVASLVLHASDMGRELYVQLGFLDSNEMYFPLK
jgi:GNAT superfamily N-acetyltransferase